MISQHSLSSVAAVVDYHADAFDASKTREGAENEQTSSSWGGRGAEYAGFGIGSPVDKDDFIDALEGKLEGQTIGGAFSRDNGNNYHRPGLDFTFSPGKSISIVALVGGDVRVEAAHRAAVATAMNYLEEVASSYRAGAQGAQSVRSDNLLYAKFEHITSRLQDPQLHTHVVIAHATRDAEGRWRALDNRQLFQFRKEADRIYGYALEQNLKTLGYATERGLSGPEIAGFDRKHLEAFSARSEAMAGYLELRGINVADASPAQKQMANLATREDKQLLSREALQQMWEAKAQRIGLSLENLTNERPQPQKLSKEQVTVSQEKVDAAVAAFAEAGKKATQRFEAHMQTALSAQGNAQAVTSSLAAMRKEIAQQRPISAGLLRSELASTDAGLKYATTEQVKAALDKAVASGLVNQVDGKYASAFANTKELEKSLVDTAISAVRDDLVRAGRDFDAAVAQNPNASVKDLMSHYKPQAALIQAEVSQRARDLGVSVGVDEMKAGLDRAIRDGRLEMREGRFTPDAQKDAQRAATLLGAAVREIAAPQLAAAVEFDLRISRPLEPSKEERQETLKALASQFKEMAPVDEKSFDASFRRLGLADVLRADRASAIEQAVSNGVLARDGDKLVAVTMADRNEKLIDRAVGSIAEDMKAAGQVLDEKLAKYQEQAKLAVTPEDVAALAKPVSAMWLSKEEQLPKNIEELSKAAQSVGVVSTQDQIRESVERHVKAGSMKEHAEGFSPESQEKIQERLQATKEAWRDTKQPSISEMDAAMNRVIDKMSASKQDLRDLAEDVRIAVVNDSQTRLVQVKAAYAEAEKKVSMTPEQLRKELANELGKPREALDRGHLDGAIQRAVDQSKLHKNVDRLSVETEKETDKRHSLDKGAVQHIRQKKQREAKNIRTLNKGERSKDLETLRKESLARMTPQQREAATRSHSATVGMVTFVAKATRAIGHDMVSNGKSKSMVMQAVKSWGARALKGAALDVGSTLGRVSGQAVEAVFKQALVAGRETVDYFQGGRGQTQYTANQWAKVEAERDNLRRSGLLTERGDVQAVQFGLHSTRRLEVSIGNVARLVAIKALESTPYVNKTLMSAHLSTKMIGDLKTTRMSIEGAAMAKGLRAACQAVSKGAEWTYSTLKEQRLNIQMRSHSKAQDVARDVFKEFTKAKEELAAGKLDKADFQQVKDRMQDALVKVEKTNDRLYSTAEAMSKEGSYSQHRLESLGRNRESMLSAVNEFKKAGDLDSRKWSEALGTSYRETKQLELAAGKVHIKLEPRHSNVNDRTQGQGYGLQAGKNAQKNALDRERAKATERQRETVKARDREAGFGY